MSEGHSAGQPAARDLSRVAGILFIGLALWLLLIGSLAGGVGINAFSIILPWSGVAALIGLALVIVPGRAPVLLVGALFGIVSAGYATVGILQSTEDFFVALAVVIALSTAAALASGAAGLRREGR